MAFNNYTLSNGLPVHAIYVSRTDEDGKVQQDRFWGTAKHVGDLSQVYVRIDIDVLQPKFQRLHYGVEITDEMRRRKRRRTAAMKKEEAKATQEKNEQWDELTQRWNCVEWEQDQVELWQQKLKERELAVAAREAIVFQRELEY